MIPTLFVKVGKYLPRRSIIVWSVLAVCCALLMIGAIFLDTMIDGTMRDMVRGYIVSFDLTLIEAIRSYTTTTLSRVVIVLTDLGAMPFYVVFGGIITIILWIRHHIVEGIMLVVCSGGSGLMTLLLKSIVMRIRPDMMPVIVETGYSFPSGHSVTAVCFYGYLAYLCYRYGKTDIARYGGVVLSITMIVMIGISRIYLGVHYPTDVIGGYIGGMMWLSLSILLLEIIQKKLP